MGKRGLLGIIAFSCCLSVFAQELYDMYTLRDLHIHFYDADYHNILKTNQENGIKEYLPADITFEGVKYERVGVRYKGNFTFMLQNSTNNAKMPLNIDMDYEKEHNLLGYKKLKLGNMASDPTYVREVLSYGIVRKYMPAPQCNFMKAYINDKYMGVFSNAESINKQFLKKHFGYKGGALFKCDPFPDGKSCKAFDFHTDPDLTWVGPDSCAYFNNYEIKSKYGWNDLVNLIDVLNNRPEEIETVLNVDRVLWFFAVATVLYNIDTYNGLYIHNYYLYKNIDGLFHVIPWDWNESMGGLIAGFEPEKTEQWNPLHGLDPYKENRPLMYQLLEDPIYMKQYMAHIRTVIEENYDVSLIKPRIDSLQEMIYPSIGEDKNYRFGLDDFHNNVEDNIFSLRNWPLTNYAGIYSLLKKRRSYLHSHPEVSKTPPEIYEVMRQTTTPSARNPVWITADVGGATQVDLMVTTNPYNVHFKPIKMHDDGHHWDGKANDGIYGGAIPGYPVGTEVKYYVRAQNDVAMKLSPQRAEYHFYSYTIWSASSVEETGDKGLIAFSDPVSNSLIVQGNMMQGNLGIYDISGRLLYREILEHKRNDLKVSLENFSSGMYILKMENYKPLKFVVK